MQVSVSLQDPFSYSIFLIIILIVLVLIGIVYFWTRKKEKVIEIKPIEDKEIDINHIKQKYIKKLNMIEGKINNNKISIRKAYQSFSVIIRYFVYELTGIKVQNYTLEEIEKLNMPILYELIKEYYEPEFSEKSLGNIKVSLEKTRKVIEKWN